MCQRRAHPTAPALLAVATLLFVSTFSVTPAGAVGAASPVPLTKDQAFVTAAYQDFLGISPTQSQMDAATSATLTSTAARAEVTRGLSLSHEWIATTVDGLYLDTLGRPGDQSGVDYWVGMIASRALTVARVAASFYASNEYFVGFGNSDNRTWVIDLYTKVLDRVGADDPSGVTYWTTTAAAHGRQAVAYAFYQSNESRHDRVKGLYQTLLGRDPDTAGWDYWAELISSRGDLALAASLAVSQEYYDRAYARYVVPETPAGVTTSAGDHQVTVSWEAPTGPSVATYTATAAPGGQYCTTSGALTCTLTHLNNRTTYTITVTATNAAGTSNPSEATAPVTLTNWQILAAPQNPWHSKGITDDGTIFGFSETTNTGEVCPVGCTSPTNLSGPAGFTTWATGMSSSGEIVGSGMNSATEHKLLVWPSMTDQPIELTAPSDFITLDMVGISTNGIVVGTGQIFQEGYHDRGAVWTSPTATPTVLDPPDVPDSPFGFSAYLGESVAGISSSGMIVGNGSKWDDTNSGLVWASPTARPTVLTAPDGYVDATVTGVSSTGTIFGFATDTAGVQHGVVWDSATASPTVLTSLVSDLSVQVTGMSSTGSIVGYDFAKGAPNPHLHGLVWSSAATAPTTLSTGPSGYTNVDVYGISAAGVIVGYGVEWASATAIPTRVPYLLGHTHVAATAMSSGSAILGSSSDANGHAKLLSWPDSADIPTVLATPDGFTNMFPIDISPTGAILGYGADANHDNMYRSVVWTTATAEPIELAAPDGYDSVYATQMSSSGSVVGYGYGTNGTTVSPLSWTSPSAAPSLLAVPDGVVHAMALGISETGMIFGTGSYADFNQVVLEWASPQATPSILAMPDGVSNVLPSAISPSGILYSSGISADGIPQRVAWEGSNLTVTPLTVPAGFHSMTVSGASSAGDVLGRGTDADGHDQQIMWNAASVSPTVINAPTGYSDVHLSGPTSAGILYGAIIASDGTQYGVLNLP